MTSEATELGEADVATRWFGVLRHQGLLVVAATALALVAMVGSAPSLFAVAGVCVALALPGPGGATGAEWVAVAVAYRTRPRVRRVVAGPPTAWRLEHRGRLDLAGRDLELAGQMGRHLESLALAGGADLCWRLRGGPNGGTWLVRDDDVAPDAGWVVAPAPPEWVTGLVLERWDHLRGAFGVAALVRVRDLSSVPPGRAALAALQRVDESVEVVVRLEILGVDRAARVARRATHRARSDALSARRVGFARSARALRADARQGAREAAVASGRALCRVGVYCVARAASLRELDERVADLISAAARGGLRLERGRGRQAPWLAALEPR
jgi:hypothetical protein